jgi:hypothetical protein
MQGSVWLFKKCWRRTNYSHRSWTLASRLPCWESNDLRMEKPEPINQTSHFLPCWVVLDLRNLRLACDCAASEGCFAAQILLTVQTKTLVNPVPCSLLSLICHVQEQASCGAAFNGTRHGAGSAPACHTHMSPLLAVFSHLVKQILPTSSIL